MDNYIKLTQEVSSFTVEEKLLQKSYTHFHGRRWMAIILCLSDIMGISFAIILYDIILVSHGEIINSNGYLMSFVLIPIIFLISYKIQGLYPGIGLGRFDELKRLTFSTTLVFVLLAIINIVFSGFDNNLDLALVIAWTLVLFLVPGCRWMVRSIAIKNHEWGEPVAIYGKSRYKQSVVDYFLHNLHLGLRPVCEFSYSDIKLNNKPKFSNTLEITFQEDVSHHSSRIMNRINTAIILRSRFMGVLEEDFINAGLKIFKHIYTISDIQMSGQNHIKYLKLNEFENLGRLKIIQCRTFIFFKRFLDIFLVIIGGLLILPLSLLIALLIFFDSQGNVIHCQDRVGKDGRIFKMYKFRTMIVNADKVLLKFIDNNPTLRSEWEVTQKIRNDPRMTKIGKLLRKFSLDEIPQLWNILKGEMSLVGPRPILEEQIDIYGSTYNLYITTSPGITGMWQISGRNHTTFKERAKWDKFYINNLSIFLDVYILIRTIWVVICCDGAY